MSDNVVIKVDKVYKDFKLPHQRKNSVKSVFTGIFDFKNQKTTEAQHALKDISLEINEGEFFGIVGRNGSGKSTLLKMLAGIYQPTKGSIQVSGKLVPFIELGVGFNPELTGRENVFLNGALLGFDHKKIEEMYDDIVAFAELERFMDQKLKNYSSGMQVRLAFSMAIRAEADILLIDEVLAVGDADFQSKCYEYFQKIKAEGITVVFVTHDMLAVRQYCDKVALIDQNRLIDVGSNDKIAKRYTQLFVKDQKQHDKGPNESKRWGNSKALFDNVKISQIEKNTKILIELEAKARESIADPTYGFMISNAAGQPIFGSNSAIEEAKVKSLSAGDRVSLSWKVPNIFNAGKYYLEFVLMYNSITEVADWWEDAEYFSITNVKKTPYIVNPQVEFYSK